MHFIGDTSFPIPLAVILVGFCWGNPKYTVVGDVLIYNCIHSLNRSIVTGTSVTFVERVYDSPLQDKYLEEICINGPVASLETLISGREYRDNLLSRYPGIFGGEMEGFGFIPTLQSLKVPWLILKGVSDLADEQFDRQSQNKVVRKAAQYLPKLIEDITSNFENVALKTDNSVQHLKNILICSKIRITRVHFILEKLNDYLNDEIGPIIQSKLGEYFYVTERSGDLAFISSFCDAILEIAQNSFKHGKSSSFEISFYPKTIILSDDGDDFELSNVTGVNGGAGAWRKIESEFLSTGLVLYSHSTPNKYKFHLQHLKEHLSNLREKCSATIIPGTIGAGYYPKKFLRIMKSVLQFFYQ